MGNFILKLLSGTSAKLETFVKKARVDLQRLEKEIEKKDVELERAEQILDNFQSLLAVKKE